MQILAEKSPSLLFSRCNHQCHHNDGKESVISGEANVTCSDFINERARRHLQHCNYLCKREDWTMCVCSAVVGPRGKDQRQEKRSRLILLPVDFVEDAETQTRTSLQ